MNWFEIGCIVCIAVQFGLAYTLKKGFDAAKEYINILEENENVLCTMLDASTDILEAAALRFPERDVRHAIAMHNGQCKRAVAFLRKPKVKHEADKSSQWPFNKEGQVKV